MNIIRVYDSSQVLEAEENTSVPHVGDHSQTSNKWTYTVNERFVLNCSVIVVGVILNLVVIIVYARKLQKSTNIFLLCLAVCDFLNCLNVSLDILKTTDIFPESTKQAICIAYPYLVDTGCLVSAGLVVCLAMDRYLRAKYLKNSLSRAHSFMLVAGIVIASIIVTSPLLLVRLAKLMRLNLWESDLMCGELYSHHHVNYTETHEMQFSNSMLFMLVLNFVILTVLSLAAVTMSVLYVKMSLEIRKKSFSRSSRSLSQLRINEETKCQKETFREVKFDEESINSSQTSSVDCLDVQENIFTKLTPKFNGNIYSKDNHDVVRRKASIFSTGSKLPSKIITPRYYCLIITSILLFLFFSVHFLLHIVNICQQSRTDMRHFFFKCLDNLYILCFILHPVIYSFFTRGFFRNFKGVFCCDKKQLYDRRRSSVDSSFV